MNQRSVSGVNWTCSIDRSSERLLQPARFARCPCIPALCCHCLQQFTFHPLAVFNKDSSAYLKKSEHSRLFQYTPWCWFSRRVSCFDVSTWTSSESKTRLTVVFVCQKKSAIIEFLWHLGETVQKLQIRFKSPPAMCRPSFLSQYHQRLGRWVAFSLDIMQIQSKWKCLIKFRMHIHCFIKKKKKKGVFLCDILLSQLFASQASVFFHHRKIVTNHVALICLKNRYQTIDEVWTFTAESWWLHDPVLLVLEFNLCGSRLCSSQLEWARLNSTQDIRQKNNVRTMKNNNVAESHAALKAKE